MDRWYSVRFGRHPGWRPGGAVTSAFIYERQSGALVAAKRVFPRRGQLPPARDILRDLSAHPSSFPFLADYLRRRAA